MNDQTHNARDDHYRKPRALLWHGLTVGFLLLLALFVVACSSAAVTSTPLPASADSASQAETEEPGHSDESEEHEASEESEEHGHADESEEHERAGNATHGVPDDAAAVPNPVAATDDSIASGAALFATTCVVCHGETGMGDGPAAESLDPKPANLQEDHVQALSDGALFYIIGNGVEGTAMVAWDGSFSDDEIWHLVNYLRAFHRE